MIVLGVLFRCLDPMIIIGAAAASRPLFVSPPGLRKQAEEARLRFVENSKSDHITIVNGFRKVREMRQNNQNAAFRYAQENFIHFGAFSTIEKVGRQIEELLKESSLIRSTRSFGQYGRGPGSDMFGSPEHNENSGNVALIKSLLLAGTHPNLAVATGGRLLRCQGDAKVQPHPSSVNAPKDSYKNSGGTGFEYGTLLSFSSKNKSSDGSNLYLRETTESTPLMAALFGGPLRSSGNILEMDQWLPFKVFGHPRAAKAITEFRKGLDRVSCV
jgi:ATP-dependent RNA helicase DHX36